MRYLGEVIRPLVLTLPKMSGYVRTFKLLDKDEDKDKNKNKKQCLLVQTMISYQKNKKYLD